MVCVCVCEFVCVYVCVCLSFCLCWNLGINEKEEEMDSLFYIVTCCFASCGQIGVLLKNVKMYCEKRA